MTLIVVRDEHLVNMVREYIEFISTVSDKNKDSNTKASKNCKNANSKTEKSIIKAMDLVHSPRSVNISAKFQIFNLHHQITQII